jgi:hypothetical protein
MSSKPVIVILQKEGNKNEANNNTITMTITNNIQALNCTIVASQFSLHTVHACALQVLLGSEQGVPILVNLKNRRANNGVTLFDGGGRHFGPIAATHRHPVHDKFFLTVIMLGRVCMLPQKLYLE